VIQANRQLLQVEEPFKANRIEAGKVC
jgi:hypothetical protein